MCDADGTTATEVQTIYIPVPITPADAVLAVLEIPIGLASGVVRALQRFQDSVACHVNYRTWVHERRRAAVEISADADMLAALSGGDDG